MSKFISFLASLLLFALPLISHAAFEPLPANQAFNFTTTVAKDNHSLVTAWQIAPNYHLYRERFSFNLLTPASAQLGTITLPPGVMKKDDILGAYQAYESNMVINVPLRAIKPGLITLAIAYQGCADAGFCYPPVTRQITIASNGSTLTLLAPGQITASKLAGAMSEQDQVTHLLAGKNWWWILGGFLGFGLLLAFTPCVLPMIPILSSIIIGQGKSITVRRAFSLSLTYVLAMAFTYAGAGIVASLAGSYVQAFLQNAWVIGFFSLIFALLALSLFGLYELRLPHRLHHYLMTLNHKQNGGKYAGVAIMGCLATLIVSPCVTAPLIGALSYIAETGDAFLGGSALFAMGVGMGIPLLIIGTLGGEFLPKAGHWMQTIKIIFGILLLASAILLLSRILSPHLIMGLWAALFIISAIYMGALTAKLTKKINRLLQGLSLMMLVYGVLLLIGAALGNTDPLQPLASKNMTAATSSSSAQTFQTIKNLATLQQALATAKAQGKPVIVDFYADWCISCKAMERNVFNNPAVQKKLNSYLLLRADVTANDEDARALEQYFGVVAPPTVLFFTPAGEEIAAARLVGEVNAQDFLKSLA
jgi:thiol:disulfide interchange protein DsbD